MLKQKHQPVLLDDVVRLLDPKLGEAYLDATAGYGGHTQAIIDNIGKGRAILVDRDRDAVQSLNRQFGNRVEVIHDSFLAAAVRLEAEGNLFDMILLDLGVSSPQLDEADRGFSFTSKNLDMRMDQRQELTAADVVNGYNERDLADVIYRYGEEHKSWSVASAIVRNRPITSAEQLARVVRSAVKGKSLTDPATRTFQAIRIEVNEELSMLSEVLPVLVRLLVPGGRLAVISFHSLEDRIVKQYFDRESRDCICPPEQPVCTCDHVATIAKLTKKPVLGKTNDANNPRARSAKLRAAVKINKKQKEGAHDSHR